MHLFYLCCFALLLLFYLANMWISLPDIDACRFACFSQIIHVHNVQTFQLSSACPLTLVDLNITVIHGAVCDIKSLNNGICAAIPRYTRSSTSAAICSRSCHWRRYSIHTSVLPAHSSASFCSHVRTCSIYDCQIFFCSKSDHNQVLVWTHIETFFVIFMSIMTYRSVFHRNHTELLLSWKYSVNVIFPQVKMSNQNVIFFGPHG